MALGGFTPSQHPGLSATQDDCDWLKKYKEDEASPPPPPFARMMELSEYELERLANIRANQDFLSSIKLSQAREELRQSVRPAASKNLTTRSRPTTVRKVLTPRKSRRLQGKKPLPAIQIPPPDKKTHGPLPMQALNTNDSSRLPPMLLELCSEKPHKEEHVDLGLKEYPSALAGMTLGEDGAARVVGKTLYSMALHPGHSSLLAAAGGTLGYVGLWKPGATWGKAGVLLFRPHTRQVSCMAFSPTQPSHLLSLSHDGSLRCMDVEKAVFHDVYNISNGLRTFDFLSEDGSTLVVGEWYGDITVVDRRTPGTGHEWLFSLGPESPVNCVSVHPRHKQYFVVAEGRAVKIYDSRCLKGEAVSELPGYELTACGAYFSPRTGNRVVSVSKDTLLRIHDTSAMIEVSPLLRTMREIKMCTSSRVSHQSAMWDPKQEECFAVVCRTKPRRVPVYHQSGQLIGSLYSEDHLSSVLSFVAFHPTRNALLGGNSDGRLHMFTD